MPIEIRHKPFDVAAAEAEVAALEAKYGVPSERHCEPFTVDGRLHEHEDWRRWDFLLACLHRARPSLSREQPNEQ